MHLNMSFSEVKKLPIRYRHWYLDRLAKHFNDKKEMMESVKSNNSARESNSDVMNKFAQFENQVNSKFS